MTNRVVYISGKMRGLKDYGKQAFDEAEKRLKEDGFTVLNPSVLPNDLHQGTYMPICTAMIDASDYVYVLKGYESSVGANAEIQYAEAQGKIIQFQENDIY